MRPSQNEGLTSAGSSCLSLLPPELALGDVTLPLLPWKSSRVGKGVKPIVPFGGQAPICTR